MAPTADMAACFRLSSRAVAAVRLAVTLIATSGIRAASGKIDREALASRHNVHLDAVDPSAPLSVGNGEFAFTADVTGLQTLNETYASFPPLQTMSHWGWHKFPARAAGVDLTRYRLTKNYLILRGVRLSRVIRAMCDVARLSQDLEGKVKVS